MEFLTGTANILPVLYLSLIAILLLNKELRAKRGALSKTLSLADLNWLAGVVFLHSAVSGLNDYTGMLLALTFTAYGLLVWLDAMLFVQYRIEVNRETITWFFKGTKGLLKGIPHLFDVLNKYWPAILIPFSITGAFWLSVYSLSTEVSLLAAFMFVIYGCSASTPRTFRVLVVLFGSGLSLLSVLLGSELRFNESSMLTLLAAFLLFINIYAMLKRPKSAFFTTPSLLPNIVLSDDFIVAEQTGRSTDSHFIPEPKSIQRSNLFGCCKGANVIMITMESLGCYVKPYPGAPVDSLLEKRFGSNRWLSEQHFSLCPNTTVSTNQIYTGMYSNNPYNKKDSAYFGAEPYYIRDLKAQGYTTLFLDSANTDLYDYWKLLERIGFDHVWGTQDIPANGLTADYRLWNMVDEIVDRVGDRPYYLHLINDQTHMPYEVVDKQRFNRHKGNSQKALYLNAVEEVDYIIDEFLNRLAQKLDLSNTILVFTGDHGESFGEYGYSFHSNSVIPEQTQVPFMLTHPKLSAKTLTHSSHFDLFPTFFDLLGIDYQHKSFGQSLALDNRECCYFFHSATLKGNTPANFSLVKDNQLYWFDRLFNQTYQFSYQHEHWSNIPVSDKQWIETMLGYNLLQKGLINSDSERQSG
ncbi:sulfatase-like hydrolase/transferase [Alteromonas gilva]|uniref:Sulfatase-like hydrolase/transferase n=1 Tax=Alteromonas gilva TaxID=2987522 RepID=A0ABT5L3W2_9ALTE|nr:sulfatase-like hydrolase/transferase [Alteromonas gilva]MDC8830468.1 sulfatase-like hydrolase/transferase [Alteromonas gilva]